MSACWGSVLSAIVLSGGRSGGTLRGPLGPRSPPKPPSPRAKMPIVLRKRRRPFVSTLSVSSTTSAAFPSASASPAMPPCDLPARKGSTSMIGTTQRSWKIRTPVARRPCGASISPLSVSTLSTIAVLESAIRNPRNNATRQLPRKAEPTASAAATVKVICENPAAKICCPISLSRLKENSMPIVNRSRMTPTSASPSTSRGSETSASALGPSSMPATMKPGSAGSLRRSNARITSSEPAKTTARSRRMCSSCTVA